MYVPYFSHYLINDTIIRKEVFEHNVSFLFCLRIPRFLFLRRIRRVVFINMLCAKYLLLLSDLERKNFVPQLFKMFK